jgi:hypothetical protein
MSKTYKTGALPSPPSVRNWRLTTAERAAFPAEWGDDSLLPGWVVNQKAGNCVAQSCAYVSGAQWGQKYDPNWIYGRRAPEDYQGEGLYLHRALHFMLHEGNVPKGSYSKGELEVTKVQEWVKANLNKLLGLAKPFKIKAYYQLFTPDEMKAARLKGYYILFAVPVSRWSPDGYNRYRTELPATYGYHCMTAWYWKIVQGKEEWCVLNSWGERWGRKGKCWMDAWDILGIQDCWAVEIGPETEQEEEEVRYKTTIKTSGPDKMAIIRATEEPGSPKAGNGLCGAAAIVIGEKGDRREIVTVYRGALVHGWIGENMLQSGKESTSEEEEE